MQIVEVISGILAQMKEATIIAEHHYQTPSKANVVMDFSVTPAALFSCVVDRTITMSGATSREKARVVIDFVARTRNLAFGGMTAEDTITAMAEIAEDFVARLLDSPLRIDDDALELRSLYDFLDTNTTGIRLTLNVSEKQGHCIQIIDHEDNEDDQDA